VTACSSNLEWLENFRARLDVDELSRLYAERWTVNKLAIDQNVTVNDELACLCSGASKACTQNEGIKTHFEKLDKVFTCEALSLASLLEYVAKLSFANAVLRA
jgi:N-acetylglutamate synthase/N-acetylornithine aminotransferase